MCSRPGREARRRVQAGAGAQAAAGDAAPSPFPDGSFDRVIAAEVLEHIQADQAASRMARVLRPGGVGSGHRARLGCSERICAGSRTITTNVRSGPVRIFTRPEPRAKWPGAGLP